MKDLTTSISLLLLAVLLLNGSVHPQLHGAGGGKVASQEALGRTWKGPSTSVFGRLLTQKKTPPTRPAESGSRSMRSQPRPAAPPMAPASPSTYGAGYTFRPAADSGVAELLANAFTTDPSERSAMLLIFRELKKSYEAEVAKENKSNDLAAAMTFFVASNVVTYHAAPMPSDAATEEVYVKLRDAMAVSPEISRLSNTEKQQVHDWLVYMGGFVLAGYVNAKNTNDRTSLAQFKQLAEQSMKLVLGLDVKDFSPTLRMSMKETGLIQPGESLALGLKAFN